MQRRDSGTPVWDDDEEKAEFVRPSLSDIAEAEEEENENDNVPFIHDTDHTDFDRFEKRRVGDAEYTKGRFSFTSLFPRSGSITRGKNAILAIVYGVFTVFVIIICLGAVHTVKLVGSRTLGWHGYEAGLSAPMTGNVGVSVENDWKGWEGLEYLFVFGDSYSDQAFDPFKTQPHDGNPFGNPDWLLPLSSGSNWVHFLTLNHNRSHISTYSLAIGGSTVDPNLVTPFFSDPHASFKAQYDERFEPIYANIHVDSQLDRFGNTIYGNGNIDTHAVIAPWEAGNTLFGVWFGINDVDLSCVGEGNATDITTVLVSYLSMLEKLWSDGARNFLLVNVPPFYHNLLATGKKRAEQMVLDTVEWNKQMVGVRDEFVRKHGGGEKEGVRVWLFDAWQLYSDVLKNPRGMEETEGLSVVDGFCEGYQGGTTSYDQLKEECRVPVNEYFWLNEMHPTYRMHNATAARIVEDCFGGEGIGGYCS